MKILGVSGSPRDCNTNYMIETMLNASGLTYELVLLKDLNIKSCNACGGCYENHKCVINDDMNGLYEKLVNADLLVFGSPTYFSNVTGIMKNFMDRCLPLYLSNELKGKKAVTLTVGNYSKGEALRGNSNNNPFKDKISVTGCLRALNDYCVHLGLKVIGSFYALHSNPESIKKGLEALGKGLSKLLN